MLNTAELLQLYTTASGSFEKDAFDTEYGKSLTQARNRYNPRNHPAPSWQDFAWYRAEEGYWETHYGSQSKFAGLALRFPGQAPPDPRPSQPRDSPKNAVEQAKEYEGREHDRSEAGTWQQRAEQSEGRSSTLTRSRRQRRSRSPTRSSSISSRSHKKSTSSRRKHIKHSSTQSRVRSRSPLPRYKVSMSPRQRSPSPRHGQRSHNSNGQRNFVTRHGSSQKKREDSEEKSSSRDAELIPHPNTRDQTPTVTIGGDGIQWMLLATASDPLTRKLQPFFALRPDGQPQFSAVSFHQNSKGAMIGRQGCHIRFLRRKFPMLHIRCNEALDSRVFYWAELTPDQKPIITTESSKTIAHYAALPMPVLPNIDRFILYYQNGKYKPPVFSPPTPTMPKALAGRHPWGSLGRNRKLKKESDDYGRLKYEDQIEEDVEGFETYPHLYQE
ncbi:hypothetical protein V8E51_016697 [Hyaloscypha variabilis]